MNKIKYLTAVVFFIFILTISYSIAQSPKYFDANINPSLVKITQDGTARFQITISNHLGTEDLFIFSLTDPYWSVMSTPASDYFTGMDIKSGQNKTTTLSLKPLARLGYGRYFIKLQIRAKKSGVIKQAFLSIDVVEQVINYTPTITANLDMPDVIDPRIPTSIKVNIKNMNPAKVDNLKIKLKSNLIEKETEISLDPEEEKAVQFTIQLDPSLKPQEDTIVLTIEKGNKTLIKSQKDIKIAPYASIFKKDITHKIGFFESINIITLRNDGNSKKEQLFITEKNIFTRSIPRGDTKLINGKKYISWKISLDPQQETTITVIKDYRSIFFILLIILIIIIAYYLLRSPIIITKSAKHIKTIEGGLREMTVLLFLKNRRNYKVHASVIEKIPKMIDISKHFDVGTIKPEKEYNYEKGTVMLWKLDLEPGEERIISYKIRAKLAIVGSFGLDPTIVKYKIGNKEGKAYSNSVYIDLGEKKEEAE